MSIYNGLKRVADVTDSANLEEQINVKMTPLSITADPEFKPSYLRNPQENAVFHQSYP